ncbi:MAG: response regulator transcription factor [Flavobacteriales bacterium]|nr:response regulator transcription factor [Flavobacteriales bacterium]
MNQANKILVAVVDDHPIIVQGITMALNEHPCIEVVIATSHGRDLIKKLERKMVDIVLMDLKMPVMDGIKTTKYLSLHFPHLKIVGLSMLNETGSIVEIIKAGAHGFISKGSSLEELVETILKVRREGYCFNNYLNESTFKC